jgi:hypothetical protein
MSSATPVIGRELAKDLPHRALTVDHRVTGPRPYAFEHFVEPRVVERTGEHRNRRMVQRFGNGVDFPIAKMPSEKQHAALLRIRLPCPFPAFDLHGIPHFRGGVVGELQQLEEKTAKMREHRTCEGPSFALALGRECGGQVLERRSPASAIETIRDPS